MEQDLIDESANLLKKADEMGITLRLIGAIAFRSHCPKFRNLFSALGRTLTDVDFVGYEKQRDSVLTLMKSMGYVIDRDALFASLFGRNLFHNPTRNCNVDVFFDELSMCHTIDLRNRLEIDCPTIPLAELCLEKMQIVELNEKDIKDTIILFREHDVGQSDRDVINGKHIAEILSADWGFYYTVTTNLRRLPSLLRVLPSADDREDVASKIGTLLTMIENEPKTVKWKMRAKIGTKKKWYQEVEEVHR